MACQVVCPQASSCTDIHTHIDTCALFVIGPGCMTRQTVSRPSDGAAGALAVARWVTDSAGVKSLKSHWVTYKQIKMERQTKGASRLARIYLGASVCKHLLTNVCARAGPCTDSMYAYLSTTALYAKMGNSFPLLPRRLYGAR